MSKLARWLPVVGFETTYEVSDFGDVRSLSRTVAARLGHRPIIGKVLKQKTSAAGYRCVQLCDGRRIKDARVHRLVAEAFIPKTGYLVRHIDGDKKNNRLDNLAWGSQLDNEADKRRHGRIIYGPKHHNAKLTADLIRQIRSSAKTDLQWSKELGVARNAIYSVRKGLTWSHVQ